MSDDRPVPMHPELPPGVAVAILGNAETAVQSALDAMPQNTVVWGDWEDTFVDTAYGHVEQIRQLLDTIEERLLRGR